jgi:hypothetical protein
MSYCFGTNVEALYNLGASVTKNTYTTAAPITALAASAPVARIPYTFWKDNPIHQGIWVHAEGTITNAATAATFIGQACLNTTAGTLAGSGFFTYWPILAPTASTVCLFVLDVRYTCTAGGTSGTLQYNSNYEQSVVASGTLSTAQQVVKAQGTVTVNTEVDLFPELFGTWSSSSASNSTVVQQFTVFGLN